MKLFLCLAILGVTCNAQQRLGNGSGGGGFEGKEKSDLLYEGKRYLDAQIDTFGETTVTIIYRDGRAEIPAKHLPMSLLREHKAWLKAQQKDKPEAIPPSAPQLDRPLPNRPDWTIQNWQAEAIRKYPDLAKAGSPFHTKFFSLHAELKEKQPTIFTTPSWPMVLADRTAVAFQAEAAAAKQSAALAAKREAEEALWNSKHTIREVRTDQLSFLDKPFAVDGSIEVDSYYNWGYRGAEPTHYSFELRSGGPRSHLYMERTKAAALRKQLLDAGGSLKGSFLVVVLKIRYDASTGNHDVYELLDYRPPPK